MKIAQLVSNTHAVSQMANNAIYSHVASLANGLIEKGNEVTLFASGDSETNAALKSVYPIALTKDEALTDRQQKRYTSLLIAQCYEWANKNNADIIHSHFSLLGSFYSRLVNIPTVISIHSPIDNQIKPFLMEYKDLKYISFSYAQRQTMPQLNWYANIYHGVDTQKFSFNNRPKDYVLYLGRVTEEKGVHFAIEAAKKAGVQLIIAGRSYPTEGYWHSHIEKHIDGNSVRYVGEQSFENKIEWLQNAKALLFPTQYNEVFGYVMIEAMSCGTPVIAWNKGSVPEVVKSGVTGFIVESVDEMVDGIKNIDSINRKDARSRAEIYFSVEKMISGYQKVYERIIRERSN